MGHHSKTPFEKQSTKDKLRLIKKERKQKIQHKRARLIIRNLPFEANEENLREHFVKFGEIEDVKVLKKDDGKLVGCGFVQYKLVQKAAKARHHLNGKAFLGREIEVDFALAKDKFKKKAEVKVEVKEEEPVEDDIKTEPIELNENPEIVENKYEISDEEEEEEKPVKPKYESNDTLEGRTVFVKNVPFSATNEDLKNCMKQFGPVFYALICIDKFTEHSKGTAFVKFVNVEDAEKALTAGTELKLDENILDCHKALARNEIKAKSDSKTDKTTKDSRNLYLVKEGVVLAGSKAAEGVSAADMAKRLQLEQYKTQMLRNLNMFISKDRLIIHNLPNTLDEKKLRTLIQNNSPKKAIIKEVRIMRDMKNLNASGIGPSKEFGFVTFNKHEDAVFVLRKLNNNPNIFSTHRRPIVAFSIENKTIIKIKQRRLEKSKMSNPKSKEYNPDLVKKSDSQNEKVPDQDSDYMGIAAKPGIPKMRSRYNLKTQAKLHSEQLSKEKLRKKLEKKTINERRKDFTKQPKQKIGKKTEKDNFAKLVADYKRTLLTVPKENKTKWYE